MAVQFVINYEEGSENCVLDGDAQSEHLLRLAREGVRLCGVDVLRSALLVAKYSMLRQRSKHVHAFSLALTCPHARAHTHTHTHSEIVGAQPYKGQRHMNMESLYEYGSRAGFWRLHRCHTSARERTPARAHTHPHPRLCQHPHPQQHPHPHPHPHPHLKAHIRTQTRARARTRTHTHTHRLFVERNMPCTVYACALAVSYIIYLYMRVYIHTYALCPAPPARAPLL